MIPLMEISCLSYIFPTHQFYILCYKFLESVLADCLSCITMTKNFFSQLDVGFCEGRSCEDQITQIVQAIQNSLN